MPQTAARRLADTDTQTTWEERFSDVIARFLGGQRPPLDLVRGWFTDDDDGRLQSWILGQTAGGWWQGIELIDAAEALADTPMVHRGHHHAERTTAFTRPTPVGVSS